jgi:hypothetical protein
MDAKPIVIRGFCGWDVFFKSRGINSHYDDIRIRANDVRIYYKNVTLSVSIDDSVSGLRAGDVVKRAIVYPIQGIIRIWSTKGDTCFCIALSTLGGTVAKMQIEYPIV